MSVALAMGARGSSRYARGMAKKKFQWVAGEEPEEPQRPGRGRSRRKREAAAVELLGARLLDQPELWEGQDVPEDVRHALHEGRRLKARGGRASHALRRHLRYLGGLLRAEDAEAFRSAMERHLT